MNISAALAILEELAYTITVPFFLRGCFDGSPILRASVIGAKLVAFSHSSLAVKVSVAGAVNGCGSQRAAAVTAAGGPPVAACAGCSGLRGTASQNN